MTAQAAVFSTVRDVLDSQGIAWAVLHGGDSLPHKWRNDLDLWVGRRFCDATVLRLSAGLSDVGHPIVSSFDSSVGTRALWCAAPGAPAIQLDFSYDVLAGTRARIMKSGELAASVDPSGAFPSLTPDATFVYLLAKRLEKGLNDLCELDELSDAASSIGEVDVGRVLQRLIGDRAAGLLDALEAGLAPANTWLSEHRRAMFIRAFVNDPLGWLQLQIRDGRRLIDRVTRPVGIVVATSEPSALLQESRSELATAFRDVVPDSVRRPLDVAQNRLVVTGRSRVRWPRPDLCVPLGDHDGAHCIVAHQADRMVQRHQREAAKTTVPVLCYHAVGLDPAHRHGGKVRWEIEPSRLQHDLDWLSALGYRIIPLDRNRSDPGRDVVLTFDDANHTDLDVVLPMLMAHGASATFFVPTAKIGSVGYLDGAALVDLTAAGMEIGSHGHVHAPMTLWPPGVQRDHLTRSKDCLEEIIGREVSSFAYPGGLWTEELASIVSEVGYRSACTVQWRHGAPGLPDFHVPRCMIGNGFYRTTASAIVKRSSSYRARGVGLRAREALTR